MLLVIRFYLHNLGLHRVFHVIIIIAFTRYELLKNAVTRFTPSNSTYNRFVAEQWLHL